MGHAERNGGLQPDRGGPDRVGVPIKGSGLARIEWRGEDDRLWVSLAPEGTGALDAWRYPVAGPPDMLDRMVAMGMPPAMAVVLHNELHAAGILTARDVRAAGARERIAAALQRSMRLGVEEIVAAYTAT